MAAITDAVVKVPRIALTQRRDLFPYMLALPIIIYEGIFILIPILQQITTSFSSDVFGLSEVNWVGLTNYSRMWNDRNFWNSVRVTLIYMVATVILAVVIGLLAALILNQRFRGRSIARAIMTLPWALPDIPTAIIFFWILNPSFGVINVLARLL